MEIQGFFDPATHTVSYLVWDPASRAAAVIDPVLDFDAATGTVSTASVDALLARADALGLTVLWSLETHVHADHLSAAQVVRARTGARVAIGAAVRDVQALFAPRFGMDLAPDGADFDRLLDDGDTLAIGALTLGVLHVPGHTPADCAYRVHAARDPADPDALPDAPPDALPDALFVGDTIFMPDFGTARADFPGGSARTLHRSITRLLALPPETRVFVGHDYKAPGRDHFAWETTIADQCAANVHVGGGVAEDAYAARRAARDAELAAPALLLPALQVNLRAGKLPPADAAGRRYLALPLAVPADLASAISARTVSSAGSRPAK